MYKKLGLFNTSLFLSLYITQYVGIYFFTEAFVAILRKNGVSLQNLGFIYMLGLFWVIRFLWAPLIDKFKLSKKGHYKTWIVLFQTLMTLTLFISSFFSIQTDLQIIVLLAVSFAFFSASQDVALDALVFKDVSLKLRPFANSLKSSGGMLGTIIGGGLGLVIYDYFDWFYTMILLCLITLNSLVQLYFYKEKQATKENENNFSLTSYFNFWKSKRRFKWLFFIILYPISVSTAFSLISPILVDRGWELAKIGFYIHTLGYLIGAIASFASSYLINRFGKRKVLIIGGFGQLIGLLFYLVPLNFIPHESLIILIVSITFSFYAIAFATITTLMMDECSNENPATEFAMQHSIMQFAMIIYSSLGMYLSGILGYEKVILLFCIFGLVAVFMAIKLELKEEEI